MGTLIGESFDIIVEVFMLFTMVLPMIIICDSSFDSSYVYADDSSYYVFL